MKKVIIAISIIILFSSNKCENKKEISVNLIWDKYLKTVAEREIIENIKTAYITETFNSERGSFDIERQIKFPNKMYKKINFSDGRNEINIYNDNKGIVIKNGIREKMNNQLMKDYKELSLIFPEFHYTEKNGDISYSGIIKEGDDEYYKIKINDIDVDYLINAKNYELYKMVGSDFEFIPEKRKMTNGISIMYSAIMVFEKKDTARIKINEIEYNRVINDTIFNIE